MPDHGPLQNICANALKAPHSNKSAGKFRRTQPGAAFPGPFSPARYFPIIAVASILLTAGCQRKSTTDIRPAGTQTYLAKGLVVELRLPDKTARIRHEAVPGYMPAMTMPFQVKDAHELDRLEAGDSVSFRIVTTDKDAWIDQVKRINIPANTNLPTTGPFRFVRDVEPFKVGDLLPDYRFTNELGEAVHLQQYQGKALAISFIFTRCPYPTFCPRMSGHFANVQDHLNAAPVPMTNWQLLTVSFDPDYDIPDRLKAYARTYRYDPNHWSFLTGDLLEITALADQSGVSFGRDETGSFSHNLRTVIVDAAGRVQTILSGNQWTP